MVVFCIQLNNQIRFDVCVMQCLNDVKQHYKNLILNRSKRVKIFYLMKALTPQITASLMPLTDSWCMLGASAIGVSFLGFFDHEVPNLLAVIVLAIRVFLPFWIASAIWLFVLREILDHRAGYNYDLPSWCLKLGRSNLTSVIVRQTTT